MSAPKPSYQLKLSTIRQEIDIIDQQLIELLTQRSECVDKIAAVKCQHKLSIYDGARENKIIDRVIRDNPSRYQAVDMASIFHAILRAGLNQQLLYRSDHEE